jgi:hypothetical protein
VAGTAEGVAEPKIPNMRGIMSARTKPLTVVEPVEVLNNQILSVMKHLPHAARLLWCLPMMLTNWLICCTPKQSYITKTFNPIFDLTT